VPHLEAAARISVPTLMNTVNSFVAGMNQIREEIRVLRRIRISPPNDQFEGVLEVSFGTKLESHQSSSLKMSMN